MKKLVFVLLLLPTILFAKEKVPTTIKKVTVYLDGAQITRHVTLELPIGTTQFTFDKLSPYVQESSIQVSGLEQASILSINYAVNYISKQSMPKDIETLHNKIKALQDQIQFENNLVLGYKEELSVIQTNRRLGNDSQIVNFEKLQQFATYYRKRITQISTEIYQSQKKKKTFQIKVNDIKKQLVELNANKKVQTGEITIKLNTTISRKLNLILKYNVSNAGWFPIYDLKAEKINTPIQLAYKAHVYQTTGSNWDNIKLTLSTSDPNTNNIKPDVIPKYLNFISRYSNYKSNRATRNYNFKYNPLVQTISGIVTDESGPLPGVSITIKGTTIGTETDFDGKYTLKTNGGKELQFSFVGMQTETLPIHSSIMNVSLNSDHNLLEEVVVTGYATNSLAGSVSGVTIRGQSSKNENSLYIIDGVPMDESTFNNLNEDDIETIEVLKRSEASSIYGSRGRNGVVIITTKGSTAAHGDNIEQGITNTRFEIKKKYSIPTDGDVTVIEIENYAIPASYAYFAAPVLNENVFLTAKIGNWEQYNLLPAEANIYFEGSYSGKTNINPHTTTDSLTVSLGVDPNITVKRNQLNNYKKKAFIGNNRILNKAYEIEIKNTKNSAIDLILLDRIPISQNRSIKVEAIETGIADYNRKNGLLKWKIKLPSGKSKKHIFSYTLKYPKYKKINL